MKKQSDKKIILAIETSCDETAAAVLEFNISNGLPVVKTLSSIINSQTKLHSKMGGVVPEAAARAHVKNILPVVQKALVTCSLSLTAIDYIAVTQGPGLITSLIIGVEFAKALSMTLKKPIVPVNHMLGHLYSPFSEIRNQKLEIRNLFPCIALIVSGGHTMIVLMTDAYNYKVIGQTVDDAAGEAFDKVAKMLKLPYPGGPVVAKMADESKKNLNVEGELKHLVFPRPMLNSKNYDFSFSGLKTAVLYKIKDLRLKITEKQTQANLCAAFQDAVVDVLVTKTLRAAKEFKAKTITLSGGVAANQALRETLQLKSQILNLNFFAAQKNLTGDNAEMIGLAAAFMLAGKYKPKSYKTIKADSNLEL